MNLPVELIQESTFMVDDKVMPGLYDTKIGNKHKVIINYEVIEKTENYAILRILYVHPSAEKRIL